MTKEKDTNELIHDFEKKCAEIEKEIEKKANSLHLGKDSDKHLKQVMLDYLDLEEGLSKEEQKRVSNKDSRVFVLVLVVATFINHFIFDTNGDSSIGVKILEAVMLVFINFIGVVLITAPAAMYLGFDSDFKNDFKKISISGLMLAVTIALFTGLFLQKDGFNEKEEYLRNCMSKLYVYDLDQDDSIESAYDYCLDEKRDLDNSYDPYDY